MIQCPQCSHECLDGTLFCDDCGCDLAGVEPQGAAAAISSSPSPSPSIAPAPANATPPSSTPFADPAQELEVFPGSVASTAPVVAVGAATGGSRLVVVRGVKPNEQFQLWDGDNVIGRMDDKHVDIDLESQESPDRQWVSRQHALIRKNGDDYTIEDIGSGNGTFVNRGSRLQVGQTAPLQDGDTIQIGTVHMKFIKG